MPLIRGDMTILREKKLEDAPTDYAWRVDEELSALDATTPMRMSYSSFVRLFEDELRHPVPWSKRFAVETFDEKLIGNCMYYDIDNSKGQAEARHNDWGQGLLEPGLWHGRGKYPGEPRVFHHIPETHIPPHPDLEPAGAEVLPEVRFCPTKGGAQKRLRVPPDGVDEGQVGGPGG